MISSTGLPDLAVVLAGGSGRRLGGIDKARLVVDGRTLLDRALTLLSPVPHVVVVGPDPEASRSGPEASRSGPGRVRWTQEEPASGGPAAGVLAGLALLEETVAPPDEALVLVLAVDMPRVTEDTVRRLTAAARADRSYDGALLDDGRRQYLCAAYGYGALRALAPGRLDEAAGLPMHRLVGGLRLAEVTAHGEESHDLDTWEDVVRDGGGGIAPD